MPRPADLPDYGRPPIDEVAFSLQFPTIPGFTEAHTGLFWEHVREQFPTAQSHPRVEAPIESLIGPSQMIGPGVEISLGQSHQGRIWLVTSDDSELLQIQDSRFGLNWRRRELSYPRFEPLLDRFLIEFERFQGHVITEGLTMPPIQQLELTYINWITDMPVGQFLRCCGGATLSDKGVGPEAEDQNWAARYLVRSSEGAPVGRLYAQCFPAMRLDPTVTAGSQFVLAFRAPVQGPIDPDRLSGLFLLGRSAIVNSFTDLTTADAQKVWERKS